MQKKYKVQYEYINEKSNPDTITKPGSSNNNTEENKEKEKKYVILDPSKEYSIISSKRLKNEGIDINKLLSKSSFKLVYLTELERLKEDGIDENKLLHKPIFIDEIDGIDDINNLSYKPVDRKFKNFLVKFELNLLIGKEKIEKKIFVFVSEESNEEFHLENDVETEEFHLGNDFLSFNSFYLVKKIKDNTTKYILRQEAEIEDNTPDMKDDIPTIKEEEISENEENTPNNPENNSNSKINRFINFDRNNLYFITLIVVMFAIIYMQHQSLSSLTMSKRSYFEEFIKYTKELGYEVDSLKLPSNKAIKRNIIDCNNLAIKIDRSKAFKNTGPQLVINLNEFSEKLEIAKYSYTKMYGEGVWFFWNFEQSIKNILDYISNKSSFTDLLKSIQDTIEALNTFYSSVEKAYEATLSADSFRNGIHSQVVRAKEEMQKSINNISAWDMILSSVSSIKKVNDLTNGITIAKKTELFLKDFDSDLERIAKILFNFKENLDKRISMLHKLQVNVLESLEMFGEIKRINELFNTIKANHKRFKLKNLNFNMNTLTKNLKPILKPNPTVVENM